ncbi:chaplin family protein [Streptomyces flavidovirens]|uniref:Chaplin family protein n=1 Tax=Streptomyces flavidovirens TaxID=67298 RepID=A0ABW6RS28_9ACTN
MIMRRSVTVLGLACSVAGMALGAAPSASAGGIGDFLSPAFGTNCANHHGAHAAGTTTHGTGTANGNLAELPVGSPLNQCGGADLPDVGVLQANTKSFIPSTYKNYVSKVRKGIK